MATKRPTGAYPKSSKKSIANARFNADMKSGKMKRLSGEVITPASMGRLAAKVVLSAAKKAAIKRAVRENVAEKTAQRVGAKANPMRRAVSNKDAKEIAKSTVGKYPPSRPPRAVLKPGTGLSARERARVSVKQPVKRTQGTPLKPEDIARKRAMERNARVGSALTPLKPRGVRSGGKVVAGPKTNPRTVNVAKPSAATTRAKQVNPGDRKLDASRRAGMKDANESRTLKTPAQRELEQRTSSRDNIGSPSLFSDPQMREAERRVSQGLREIKAKEKIARAQKAKPSKPVKANIPGRIKRSAS